MKTFIDFCKYQHDIECNQKYDGNLPYSFHLNLVAKQVQKFDYIFKDEIISNPDNYRSIGIKIKDLVLLAAWGHDLIEDARTTYNDIVKLGNCLNNYKAATLLADIIYSCTELRGRNRSERHGPEYIQGLKDCRLGLFVKLCDISANIGYGLLTNSSMCDKYKSEFPKLKDQLYTDEFKPLWDYIEKLLNLK